MREIKKITNKLINKYKTRDPFEMAEELGIWIYETDLGNIEGHYMYAKRKKVFFINSNLSEQDRLLCCAHELGHALLHTKSNVYFNNSRTFFNQSRHENEADEFAAELILNDNLLSNYEGFPLEVISNCEQIPLKYLNFKFNK
ncbi:ImmA/IrrE family metallo-endopeptidase [Clostridium gasigenes]|uniref:ImmA/IrrE family metallo-endopeptidase n=1 Tax=Clostridium gasigenes TaxID=94869 RepID=UPI001C0CFC2C|nr:ImmA/IrrE family metallo-endopeptidase [Clostridium gasigenes]MBU3131546.1 ImmA/IrrE family metallo-endopeptidase [Clostridium gasigenes]